MTAPVYVCPALKPGCRHHTRWGAWHHWHQCEHDDDSHETHVCECGEEWADE